MGADGVRLDLGFDGLKEAKMTYNPFGLKIELNMSNDVDYLSNILTHQGIKIKSLAVIISIPKNSQVFLTTSSSPAVNGLKNMAFVQLHSLLHKPVI